MHTMLLAVIVILPIVVVFIGCVIIDHTLMLSNARLVARILTPIVWLLAVGILVANWSHYTDTTFMFSDAFIVVEIIATGVLGGAFIAENK